MSSSTSDPHASGVEAEERLDDLLPEKLCMWLSSIALIAMVALTSLEVFLRSTFNFSLEFTDEVGGYLLAALSFLSLPVALTGNAYHRVEFYMRRLDSRGRALSRFIFNFINLVMIVVLDWQLFRLVARSYGQDDRASTLLGTPLWIPQSFMILGATILVFTLLRMLALDWRLYTRGRTTI